MNTNSAFRFGMNRRFKSLPDGRRVYLADFPWSGHYVIPDDSTQQQLYQKTRRAELILWFSLLVVFAGLLVFRDLLGRFVSVVPAIAYLLLATIIRGFLFRSDLRNLQKIDYESVLASFHNEFSKNLRTSSNDSLPNYQISTLLDIPSSKDKLILLRYTESFPNLLRCQLDGSILWQAQLPIANDVYTNVEWKDEALQAFSRSCQSVVLDVNTGRILSGKSSIGQNRA